MRSSRGSSGFSSTGEGYVYWTVGNEVLTTAFLQSLAKGCPWGPLHSEALLAKPDLPPARERPFNRDAGAGFGRASTQEMLCTKMVKGFEWRNGVSTTVPFHFLFSACLFYFFAWLFVNLVGRTL